MSKPMHNLARVVLTIIAIFARGCVADAQTDGACDKFDWPLVIEREWFAANDLLTMTSSTVSQPTPGRGFILTLNPSGAGALPYPPSRPNKVDSGHAGFAAFDAAAGQSEVQITLSADGWIDVIQDGAPLPPTARTRDRGCLAISKSVRFKVLAKPFILQVGGVTGRAIKVGIRTVPATP